MSEKLPMLLPDPDRLEENEARVRAGFWRKVRRVAGRIPFAREAVAAWYATRDPATPPHVKAVLMAALAYFVMPADALPDFLPVFGFADDASLFWAVWQLLSRHVTDEHRARATAALDDQTLDGGLPPE